MFIHIPHYTLYREREGTVHTPIHPTGRGHCVYTHAWPPIGKGYSVYTHTPLHPIGKERGYSVYNTYHITPYRERVQCLYTLDGPVQIAQLPLL